jgi:hypothetical protein
MTEKKVTKRKTVAKKAKPKTAFDMLEDSFVGAPIRIANRTFLASLGLVSTMQTEFTKFQADFEKTFSWASARTSGNSARTSLKRLLKPRIALSRT